MQLLFVSSDQLDQPGSSDSFNLSSSVFLDLVLIAGISSSLIRRDDILEEEMSKKTMKLKLA
jgi:hypothetical protein